VSHLPKSTCCKSTPRCARCPVRLALEARARESRGALAQLFDEVYYGTPAALPEPVTEALAAIAAARTRASAKPAESLV
jgi:hypothetical protein